MSFDGIFELAIAILVGTVFKRQNWIKILVFTVFFLGYFTTILLQSKNQISKKKVLIVANKTVLFFLHAT